MPPAPAPAPGSGSAARSAGDRGRHLWGRGRVAYCPRGNRRDRGVRLAEERLLCSCSSALRPEPDPPARQAHHHVVLPRVALRWVVLQHQLRGARLHAARPLQPGSLQAQGDRQWMLSSTWAGSPCFQACPCWGSDQRDAHQLLAERFDLRLRSRPGSCGVAPPESPQGAQQHLLVCFLRDPFPHKRCNAICCVRRNGALGTRAETMLSDAGASASKEGFSFLCFAANGWPITNQRHWIVTFARSWAGTGLRESARSGHTPELPCLPAHAARATNIYDRGWARPIRAAVSCARPQYPAAGGLGTSALRYLAASLPELTLSTTLTHTKMAATLRRLTPLLAACLLLAAAGPAAALLHDPDTARPASTTRVSSWCFHPLRIAQTCRGTKSDCP